MDIVLKLRELRRMRRLTQKQAAEKSGVHEKTISSMETGARIDSLKLVDLLQLLHAYEMPVAEFFGGGVERAILMEIERFSPIELQLMSALRLLPELARERLEEGFLAAAEREALTTEPVRLRAVR